MASAGIWREADKFADYWHSKPGAAARKSDWAATWRNWCRNAKPAPEGRSGAPPGKTFAERDAENRSDRIHEMTGGIMGKKKAAVLPDFIDMEASDHGKFLG
jgi:hypothetical protein